MNDAAYIGLAADLIEAVEPHTEADRTGLLLTFLAAFGAAVGRGPHAVADGTAHPGRLNVVLVGRSARARKGTSWAVIRCVFDHADPDFARGRVIGGLTSGEGLVAALDNRPEGLARSVLVHEPEFGRVLRVATRSATLSALIREAWDGGDLAVMTRSQPLRVSDASVSVLGHVTADELRRRLDSIEIASGLANRFLFGWVERSKRLPDGSTLPPDDLEAFGVRIRHAIDTAQDLDVMHRSERAAARWSEIYCALDDDIDGVLGSLTARAEPQMLRLSVLYALLDGTATIELEHVDAAKAVWDYCEQTIAKVFGEPHHDVIVRLFEALCAAGSDGLDGAAQHNVFSRHVDGHRLARARWELERRGIAHTTLEHTGGRPKVVTRLASLTGEAVSSLVSQAVTP